MLPVFGLGRIFSLLSGGVLNPPLPLEWAVLGSLTMSVVWAAAGKEAMAWFIQVPHVQRLQRGGQDPVISGRRRYEDTR